MSATDARDWDDDRWARAVITSVFPADSAAARVVADLGAPAALQDLLHRRDGAADCLARLPWLASRETLASRLAALGWPCELVVPADPAWPSAVDDLPEPPVALWVLGAAGAGALTAPGIAVVGARAATAYGVRVATNISADLAAAGWSVVSGGAFGVDAAAHRGALTSGTTTCVLACGVDIAYPAAHKDLLAHIAKVGAVVSEVGLGQPARRYHFLARNRIIAALTRGTVLVEAAHRSGSLSTARVALELCRQVMAVPGPVTSAMSAGVHELMRTAPDVHLVTCAGHVLESCEPVGVGLMETPHGPRDARDALSADAARMIDHLGTAGMTAAGAASAAQLSLPRAQAALAELQVAGLAATTATGWALTRLGAAPSPR